MQYFVDTEFINANGSIDPVSIGIVCETGKEFYAEFEGFDEGRATPWVRENVLARLTENQRFPRSQIRDQIYGFIAACNEDGKPPEFWGDYCAFDFVILSQIFGTFDEWPGSWPFFMYDLQQLQAWTGIGPAVAHRRDEIEHYALHDARLIKRQYEDIMAQVQRLEAQYS